MPSRLALLGVSGPTAVVVPPSAFLPSDIYGLEAWYYQPDLDYAAGTWTDRSGNARNLTQATAGKRPTLSAVLAELNAKYGLTGDGADDFLASAGFTLNQPDTSLMVGRQITWTDGDYLQDGLAANTLAIYQRTATPNLAANLGAAVDLSNEMLNRFQVYILQPNGASGLARIDGISTSGNFGAGNAGGVSLFGAGGDSNWSNAQIADWLVYRGRVGAYDLLRLQNEWIAADRYNIPVTFNPTSITGCRLWVRGDDLGAVDSAISSWTDQSGNAHHAAQGTGANQPLVKRGVNGKKYALFDGSNDNLKTGAFTLNNPFTIFIVGRSATDNTGYFADGLTADRGAIYQNASLVATSISAGTALVSSANDITIPNVLSAVFNGASSVIAVNGVATIGNAGSGNAGGITLGSAGDNSAYLACDIYEAIVYNAALTDAQRQQIEGYLANKYSINAAIRPFDPLSVAGCKGWFDAAFTDQTVDGGVVTTWYDKSGKGQHFTQATATNKPTYRATTGPNSLPEIDFDGIDNFMTSSLAWQNFMALSAYAVIAVITPDTASNDVDPYDNNMVIADQTNGTIGMSVGNLSSIPNWRPWDYDGVSNKEAPQVATLGAPQVVAWWRDGSNIYSSVNGSGKVTVASAATRNDAGLLRMGVSYDGAVFFNGKISQLLLYNTAVTTADISSLIAWAAKRYNIAYKAPNHSSLVANLAGWWSAATETYADADPVTNWHDRSGNVRDLVTGTSPDFDTLLQNGRPSVKYTALNLDYLTNAAWTVLNGLTAATFFSVTKNWTGGVLFGPNGEKLRVELLAGSLVVTISSGNFGSVAITGANTNIVSVVYNGAGAANADRLKVWVNGVAQTLSFTGTIPASLGTATGLDVGRAFGGVPYMGGDALEIALFTAIALPDADRRAVENYLAQQLNVAV